MLCVFYISDKLLCLIKWILINKRIENNDYINIIFIYKLKSIIKKLNQMFK